MRTSLSGGSLSSWEGKEEAGYCNYDGIKCNEGGYITKFDVSDWSLSGRLPENLCSYLPRLRVLRLGGNSLRGTFLQHIANCTLLEELNVSFNHLTGTLPDFSPITSLRVLDLAVNDFSGEFPISVTNLTNLEVLHVNLNNGFLSWQLPESFSRLTKLRTLILTTCNLVGHIPPWISNLTNLRDLQLSGNRLVGRVPKEIGLLSNLHMIELYYNLLEGEIPAELGNLTKLTDLDMSENRLTGTLPESICRLPGLRVLQLYSNFLAGGIPAVIGNSTTLTMLSLYRNSMTGQVPWNLGSSSPLIGFDLSENAFSGRLPAEACNGGKLVYFLALDNKFSGELPSAYAKCTTILRFRVSCNQLAGQIAEGILALPLASVIDLGSNNFIGQISRSISRARELSELMIQKNKITGVLPPEIAQALNLVKIDLSDNLLSGSIPPDIGKLNKLNLLLLQRNMFNSSIPHSLCSLKALNILDLSDNQLTGGIPECLNVLPPNSIHFSNNKLSGPIPLLWINSGLQESFLGNPEICVKNYHYNPSRFVFPSCVRPKAHPFWMIGVPMVASIIGFVLFIIRWLNKRKTNIELQKILDPWFFHDVKSFRRLGFDTKEIAEGMAEKNIIGRGGSATVYKIELKNAKAVAVKKFLGLAGKERTSITEEQELKTEVETLGTIRHNNIVKLHCCLSSTDSRLLVYEFMPNGNLFNAIHGERIFLDWPTRHRISIGISQGLSYLHHDLIPPIIHRDIKSSNILLGADYQPKISDFGIAKALESRGGRDSFTTVIAGTYGYIAPEYAYTCKATTKCDVYSFGVLLMEMITGKKAVEVEFGEVKNLADWVSAKVHRAEGVLEGLDHRMSVTFEKEMIQALLIAVRCAVRIPARRPTMKDVVKLLIAINPCRSP